MQAEFGFSGFNLDASLYWSRPPDFGEILRGDIDLEAVIAAHEARGWTLNTEFIPGYDVLCSAGDCTQPAELDIPNRGPFEVFANNIGAKQPILLLEDILISPRNPDIIIKTAAVLDGDSPSLADRPDFQTAVAAMGDEGALVQMWFLPPDMIELVTGLPVPMRPLAGAESAMGTDDWADNPMPPVQLIAFAHIAAEDAELGRVALVYATEAEAEQAAANIPPRLDGLISLRVRQPILDYLTERSITLDDPAVFADPDTGLYTVVLTLRGEAPSDVEIDRLSGEPVTEPGTGAFRDSGMVFRPLVEFLITRDTFWYALTPDDAPPEE
jgi:hypothetical protein